jgi:hypothetical protein
VAAPEAFACPDRDAIVAAGRTSSIIPLKSVVPHGPSPSFLESIPNATLNSLREACVACEVEMGWNGSGN